MEKYKFIIDAFNTGVTTISIFLSPLLSTWFKQTRKSKWLYVLLFVLICLSIIGSFYQLIDSSDIVMRSIWVFLFVICLGIFIWYACTAVNSLDGEKENILPPKMLWQMIFNKVPSEISNVENNGQKDIFAVVCMDNSSEVNIAKDKIKSSFNENENFDIEYFEGYEEKKGRFTFTDFNKKLRNPTIRGVLFLIGPDASKKKNLKECVSAYANLHKVNPIACYWSQNKRYTLPYYKINFEELDKFVKHLASRGYSRNYLQIRLGRAYHKAFIIQGIILLLFFMGLICFGPKINKMWNERNDLRDSVENIRDSVAFYLRPKPHGNTVYSYNKGVNIFDGFDIDKFRNDTEIVRTLVDFSNYYFEDLENYRQVKLWYKNSKDSLVCILDTKNNNNSVPKEIPIEGYMIGSALKHRLFVLWPGEDNIKEKEYSADTKIVWYYDGDDDNPDHNRRIRGEIKNINNQLFWEGIIDEEMIKIPWHSDSHNDKTYGMFVFSYDEHLAVEVDIEPFTLKDYKYMSHLMFRNSVRKYIKIVTSIISNTQYKSK